MTQTNASHKSIGKTKLSAFMQVGLLAGPFMSMIDSSVVNVALPDLATAMHTSLKSVQWVASGYLLALGMALAGTAYVAKRFGSKSTYMASLIGSTLASVLCSVMPNVGALIAARIVQGICGAPMVPLAMNMLLGKGKASQQMSAFAGMILFLAPAVGPSLGGVLLHFMGWPSIFLVNLPVGVIAVCGAVRLPITFSERRSNRVSFDLLGFSMLSIGLVGVTYGAAVGPDRGWFSGSSFPFWSLGLFALLAYFIHAKSKREAIVDTSLLRNPQQSLSLLLVALVSIVTFAVIFLAPVFMQEIQGTSAVTTGLTLLPQGLITGIGAVLGTQLPNKMGVRQTVLVGLLMLTLSTVGMGYIVTSTPTWLIGLVLCGRGFAIGMVTQPLLSGLVDSLPEEKVPDGNTLFNVVERVSGTFGIALIITYFQVREQVHVHALGATLRVSSLSTSLPTFHGGSVEPSVQTHLTGALVSGFHDVIWLIVGVSALGVVLSCFLTESAKA